MHLIEPFGAQLDLHTGHVQSGKPHTQRRLRDMTDMYLASSEVDRILVEEGNRLIYEVFAADIPEQEGHVLYGTTIIYPGYIGDEFHMTKGHFHKKRDRAEVYLGLSGEGCLILQTQEGEVRTVPMCAGTVAYVPPMWAHRTANTGSGPFVFFAAWPGDAGHDYGTIEQQGFAQLLVKRDGQPSLIPNPRYMPSGKPG